jgi:MOSC domain-containing protein YiiM
MTKPSVPVVLSVITISVSAVSSTLPMRRKASPAGARLRIGEAVIEITAPPHTGCAKFKARFGAAALAFVNSPVGREQRWRGVNARVVTGGLVRVGDAVVKL